MSRIATLVVLIVSLTVLAGCGNRVVPPAPGAKPQPEAKPQYGGTMALAWWAPVSSFDPYRFGVLDSMALSSHCYEPLAMGDWARGQSGTGEYDFSGLYTIFFEDALSGILAERWEVAPDGSALTVHLRQGVRFHNKPPVNGREVTADDVKYCFDRRLGTGSGFTEPSKWNVTNVSTNLDVPVTEILAPEPHTVVFKFTAFGYGTVLDILMGPYSLVYPRELVDTYGEDFSWSNVGGTGPYVLADSASDAFRIFERNPDYYLDDELHPGNRLPYADRLIFTYSLDIPTVLAALRTGKLDYAPPSLLPQMWRSLLNTNPELMYASSEDFRTTMSMQQDAGPLSDVRVRRALQMAIDSEALAKASGGTNLPHVTYFAEQDGPRLFTPFDQLPAGTRTVYTYSPGMARNLLVEAGYANGLDVEIVCDRISADDSRLVAGYWSAIGVRTTVAEKDATEHRQLASNRTYGSILATQAARAPFAIFADPRYALVRLNDDYLTNEWAEILRTIDPVERAARLKALSLYCLDNVFLISVSPDPAYAVVQPWVGGWSGDTALRVGDVGSVAARLWLDLDMKEKPAGSR